jgi:catechol 2,3-dioxygenase
MAHMAWQMRSFKDLKELYQRLKENNVRIKHIGDHGISLGVYLLDPDDNEIEVYYELPESYWPKEGDRVFTGHFPWKLEEEPAGVADD